MLRRAVCPRKACVILLAARTPSRDGLGPCEPLASRSPHRPARSTPHCRAVSSAGRTTARASISCAGRSLGVLDLFQAKASLEPIELSQERCGQGVAELVEPRLYLGYLCLPL